MLLYFVILVSSRVSSRYHGQSSVEESNIGPPKNHELTDVSLKDDQYRKKRKIAEAILLLIEDEIMIHNLIMNNKNSNTAMLEDSGQDTIKGETRIKKDKLKHVNEVFLKRLGDALIPVNLLNWSSIIGETNNARKKRKSLKSLHQCLEDQISGGESPSAEMEMAELLLMTESKEKDSVKDNLEKTIISDGSDANSNTDDGEVQEQKFKENEKVNQDGVFYFESDLSSSYHLVPSPFRGIFLSAFNSGFADFENNFYVTAAPYRVPPSPVHFLDCSSSSTSRSSCDDNLCTVQCEDGNKVVLHCASNSVVVQARSAKGKFSYEVTCGAKHKTVTD